MLLKIIRPSFIVILALLFCFSCSKSTKYGVLKGGKEPRKLTEYKKAKTYDSVQIIEVYDSLVGEIDSKEIDAPIKILKMQLPKYPEKLQRKRIEGIVELIFNLNEKGNVENIIVNKSVHPILDSICIEAVSLWRFEPITSNGEPAKIRLKQRIPFVVE
jgi:TonB family protein